METFGRDEPEAHESLGLLGIMVVAAARVKAVATLTEVSLDAHLSLTGFGGDVMVLGPPGRELRDDCSRCFIRAYLVSADASSSSSV